ncbi:MAG TPA: DoxX family protein [Galbitalea sp.]
MDLARVILSIILALMLLVTGGGKVLDLPFSRGNRDKLSVHPVFWRVTGVLELAALVGLVWGIWFVPFGLAAAIGVALLMVGAVGFRVRTHDRAILKEGLADIAVFVLTLVVILLSILTLVR